MAPVVLGDGAIAVKGTCEVGLAFHATPTETVSIHGVTIFHFVNTQFKFTMGAWCVCDCVDNGSR